MGQLPDFLNRFNFLAMRGRERGSSQPRAQMRDAIAEKGAGKESQYVVHLITC